MREIRLIIHLGLRVSARARGAAGIRWCGNNAQTSATQLTSPLFLSTTRPPDRLKTWQEHRARPVRRVLSESRRSGNTFLYNKPSKGQLDSSPSQHTRTLGGPQNEHKACPQKVLIVDTSTPQRRTTPAVKNRVSRPRSKRARIGQTPPLRPTQEYPGMQFSIGTTHGPVV
jgi:hypothetical protein